jgi:hypothetical protein
MATGLVNSQFRLIVNCQTLAFVLPHFFLGMWRLFVEPFRSFKMPVRAPDHIHDRKDNV